MSTGLPSRTLPDHAEAEETLIWRLRRGDEEAFRELVTQHHDTLIRIAKTYVADWDMAQDVVQDTWMVVTHSLNRFEGRSSLRAWICGILAHKARDRGTRERRHRNLSWVGHRAFPSRAWDDQIPETILASRQAVDAMQRAINRLPAKLKSVLILRDRDGVEARDVCALLNINKTNLYVRLHRARERVKVAVETVLG
jgi:RNA polymerase sigma-70 factor, ECF subfamily